MLKYRYTKYYPSNKLKIYSVSVSNILDLTISIIVVNQSGLIKNNEYSYSLFLLALFTINIVIAQFTFFDNRGLQLLYLHGQNVYSRKSQEITALPLAHFYLRVHLKVDQELVYKIKKC
jgi:hypothetical protein